MKIINKRKFIKSISILLILIASLLVIIDFCKYPEKYITTWNYQLKVDVESGKEDAINYYKTTYLDNGKQLWEE